MRKSTKNASLHEALRNLWKIRIMLEKNYTEKRTSCQTNTIINFKDNKMRKSTKNASLHEALRNLWKIRIMLEKNYTETCATWMARRIESLIDHMQYGHALIAYHKQDGTFRLATTCNTDTHS